MMRVKMVRCLGYEPKPPDDPAELEVWCAMGKSGRPVQTHIGEEGQVLWVNEDGTVCVAFDDSDERVLYPGEVEFIHPLQGEALG